MTDKYEQFKEWFKHHETDEDEIDLVFAIMNLFKEFEEEQSEQMKKEKILNEISKIKVDTGMVTKNGTVWGNLSLTSAEKIYDILKREELLNE